MTDDLQREEELFLKALEEYKEKKSQEPTDKTTNTLPAVFAADYKDKYTKPGFISSVKIFPLCEVEE